MKENLIDDHNFYQAIGNKIKSARNEKKIDQESLAKILGLTRTSIINIEKGRQRPSIHQVWMMAQYLNIPITDLIPPLDLQDRIRDWKLKIENNKVIKDDSEVKMVINFISSTFQP